MVRYQVTVVMEFERVDDALDRLLVVLKYPTALIRQIIFEKFEA
jgi:hypothetical protein